MDNLVDELLELSDPDTDKKIIKTFEMKDRLCPEIFDGGETNYTMKNEIVTRLLEITDDFIDFAGVDFFILFSAGRLDADSEGLLIISNDSGLTDHLTRPDHEVAKTYEVVVKPVLSQSSLDKLRQGVEVDGRPTRKCEVEILSSGNEDMILKIVLREGRNRQIRKMVRTQGSKVKRLVRTAIGLVKLEGIAPGSFRPATPQELNSLRKQGPSAGDPRRVLKHGPVAKGRKKLLPGKNAGTPGAGNRFPDRQAPAPGQPSKDSHPRRRPR